MSRVEGRSRGGRVLREPMAGVTRYMAASTEAELRAMWAYLCSVK
ncbi:MAG: hypothetical protein SFW67_07460 [Myxococcaceae bacterium]|nr:hypothetical protein [Myxococcaceae bacterium]